MHDPTDPRTEEQRAAQVHDGQLNPVPALHHTGQIIDRMTETHMKNLRAVFNNLDPATRLPYLVRLLQSLLLVQAGNVVELLDEEGCAVTLQVDYNGGAESIELHDLNGAFRVEVHETTPIPGFQT